jgi:hypothetical protein
MAKDEVETIQLPALLPVRRKDSLVFVVKPQPRADSPLDVKGIDLGITTAEIVQFVQESRREL